MTEAKVPTPEQIYNHAVRELELSGMTVEKADPLTKNISATILGMIEALKQLEDPDKTMNAAVGIFLVLSKMKILGGITDDPAEWEGKTDFEKGIRRWQNVRDPSIFSDDGGKTFYLEGAPEDKKPSKIKAVDKGLLMV